MASSSSALTCSRRYHVFPSFHGPDVRSKFLSHLHYYFARKGITVFKDEEIERGQTIGPKLVQAIRESRVSIVVLSEKYASSSWCLDELVEILRCKEALGQIVMTLFYDVDPSHVRKQSGDFGCAFEKTCHGKTDKDKQRWSKALTYVAKIAGEHSLNWGDEGEMIKKIAADVSKKLNLTLSRDFEGMVGMEAHLRELETLLCLEHDDEVKMIGIWGPAGIGKTTIARALFSQLSSHFLLSCFMGNLKGSCKSIMGVDDYDSKLCLQSQLLCKILKHKDMRVHHLRSIKEWLQDQKVLIILDDVDDIEKLEALAKEPSWFGSGSRIIVTTQDNKILKAHGILDIYHVDFPSEEEALEIFCLSAFKQTSPHDGFEELAKKVAKLCDNLPLGLCVVGSSLRGETKVEWGLQSHELETSLDRKIEDVLRVGYDKLSKKHQSVFLHIACFFNNEDVDHVTSMLADSNLDIRNGLKILASKSLLHISTDGKIEMHYLLKKLGRQEVIEQSHEPGKRQFLVEAQDIFNVLANETGTGSVLGISFDMSKTGDLVIRGRAFERMCNLQFLRVFMGHSHSNANVRLSTTEDMKHLPRLRLLRWDSYPGALFPPTFRTECLIELRMASSKLEKLWGGIQPLANLKKVNLNFSYKLKEIPNLSKATNLETMTLVQCTSLVEFPSYILDLPNLETLRMWGCKELRVVPLNINSASPAESITSYCSGLRNFPDISTNIKNLYEGRVEIKKFREMKFYCEPWSRDVGGRDHKRRSLRELNLSNRYIEKIPSYVRYSRQLHTLIIKNCGKLVSVEGLPPSLRYLHVDSCVSLERVTLPRVFQDPIKELIFHNCLKLDAESRRAIIHHKVARYVCLPGDKFPAEFTHKDTGNSIIIPWETFFSESSRFKACLLLSPINDTDYEQLHITCYQRSHGDVLFNKISYLHVLSDEPPLILTEHVFIFRGGLIGRQKRCSEGDESMSEILFEFHCWSMYKIIACGVRILRDEDENRITEMDDFSSGSNSSDNKDVDDDDEGAYESRSRSCWSWLMKLCW
ncbi:unnamed protein product [Microthlaspi erraticum]|uniref:ADP-ribosyl cyclase/cyclic ADP-ribose hydrolase n=1 Tax=Microthlaspi erraticum TaxID=1685480 RepID=A0A6D2IK03_9BRAS|nr:unnamed protein product [Microthlaspi erraticum]